MSGLHPLDSPRESKLLKQEDDGYAPSSNPCKRASIDAGILTTSESGPGHKKTKLQTASRAPLQTTTESASCARDSSRESVEKFELILQPETQPISPENLVAEVKGIYAGLVMVEAKCIEVINEQTSVALSKHGGQSKLNNKQLQALTALHVALLSEQHDFFLASQHPSASGAVRRLASKYGMPARTWRHGIHSFLELLRQRLPTSKDHMVAFIYQAYSILAVLYETVPGFEDLWIECLGDLARYRTAIEDDDRRIWMNIAIYWYEKSSHKAPTTGRLYHHLAIPTPDTLTRLFYYTKALSVKTPFPAARNSILSVFNHDRNAENSSQPSIQLLSTSFVRVHRILFTNTDMERFQPTVEEFLDVLERHIDLKFMRHGYYIAAVNCAALLGFASKHNVLMKAIQGAEDEEVCAEKTSTHLSSFEKAQDLSNSTLEIVLSRFNDPNILPFVHVNLVFIFNLARYPGAGRLIKDFPWELLAMMLNNLLLHNKEMASRVENNEFPGLEKDQIRPFPEDFAIRGLVWTEDYFPKEWFGKIDEEGKVIQEGEIDYKEKCLELPSMTAERKERILWLGYRIASYGHGLTYKGKVFYPH